MVKFNLLVMGKGIEVFIHGVIDVFDILIEKIDKYRTLSNSTNR